MSGTQHTMPNWDALCALSNHQISVTLHNPLTHSSSPPPPRVTRLVVRVITNSLVVLGLVSTSYAIVLAVESAESSLAGGAQQRWVRSALTVCGCPHCLHICMYV